MSIMFKEAYFNYSRVKSSVAMRVFTLAAGSDSFELGLFYSSKGPKVTVLDFFDRGEIVCCFWLHFLSHDHSSTATREIIPIV